MPSRKKRKRYRQRIAEATAKTPRTCGGWGQGVPTTRSDLVLLSHAINEDWPVPENVRLAIVAELGGEIGTKDARRFLAVTRVFLAMQAANLREIKREVG